MIYRWRTRKLLSLRLNSKGDKKKKNSPDNLQQEACPHSEFEIWIYTTSKGNESPVRESNIKMGFQIVTDPEVLAKETRRPLCKDTFPSQATQGSHRQELIILNHKA